MSPQAGGAAKPDFTVAEVLRVGLPDYAREHPLPPQHWRALRAIMACRTPELGGHVYQCSHCATPQFVPHSCRNRHCPTCQGANGFAWLQAQAAVLLPIPYFHVVFTLPHALNPLIRQNPARCYELLFAAASATLLAFGEHELHARLGVTMVLHTWSQTLRDHYHVHAIVTGGRLRTDGPGWAGTPAHWLFPVRALSAMFRGKFRAGLQALYAQGRLEFHGQLKFLAHRPAFQRLLHTATRQPWVVYAKRPFAGPETVLAYLARYTHRIGLTNYRLRALDRAARTVTFAYKDYADHSRQKSLQLDCGEFIRRLRLHLLPPRFVKIRHYGLLANRDRHAHLLAARAALPAVPRPPCLCRRSRLRQRPCASHRPGYHRAARIATLRPTGSSSPSCRRPIRAPFAPSRISTLRDPRPRPRSSPPRSRRARSESPHRCPRHQLCFAGPAPKPPPRRHVARAYWRHRPVAPRPHGASHSLRSVSPAGPILSPGVFPWLTFSGSLQPGCIGHGRDTSG